MVRYAFKSILAKQLDAALSRLYQEDCGADHYLYEMMTSNRVPMAKIMENFLTMSEDEFLSEHTQDMTTSTPPQVVYATAQEREAEYQHLLATVKRIDYQCHYPITTDMRSASTIS